MNLEYLKEFCTVVQFRSITKAAEYLYLSQPSLSRHLKMLEGSLNAELIVRGNSKVFTLTPAGEMLFQQGSEILKQVQSIEKSVQRVDVGYGGSLSFSSGIVYSDTACRLIHDYSRVRDDVSIQYFESEDGPGVQNVLDGRSDISISYAHEIGLHGSEIEMLELQKDRFVAMVSEMNPLAGRKSVTTEELQPFPMVEVREPEYGFFDNSSLSRILAPFKSHSVNALTFLSMILRTRVDEGFCILPYTSAIANSAGCSILELEEAKETTALGLVWSASADNPCVKSFIDFAQRRLNGKE